jgi:hypothetical protein
MERMTIIVVHLSVGYSTLLTGGLHAHRDGLGNIHFVVPYHDTPEYVGSGYGVSGRSGREKRERVGGMAEKEIANEK